MANLNFYQPTQEKQVVKSSESKFGAGIFVGLAFMLLPVAVWGGLKYYNQQLDNSIAQVKSEIETAGGSLDRKVLSRVATFVAKVTGIEVESLKRDNPSEKIFNVIQSNVLKSGVVATIIAYNEEKREVGFTFEADNFELVAKQLMKLKSLSENFSDVDFVSSNRQESGKLSCEFKLVLK